MKTYIVKKIKKTTLKDTGDRAGIIGGSDIGTLAGLKNTYGTIHRVWKRFCGEKEQVPAETQKIFDAGHRFEGFIAQWFADETGTVMTEPDYQYVDPDHPELILHPDREFNVNGKRYALECKTASSYAMRAGKWDDPQPINRNILPDWFPKNVECFDGSTIMSGYMAQCYWYYALAGYEGVFLARETDNKLFIYYLEPDLKREEFLYKKAIYWLNRFKSGEIILPETSEDVKEFYKEDNGETLEADAEMLSLIGQLRDASEAKKASEEIFENLKNEVQKKMQNFHKVIDKNGKTLCTWNTSYRVDEKKVMALPDWKKKYSVLSVDGSKVKTITGWQDNLARITRTFLLGKY